MRNELQRRLQYIASKLIDKINNNIQNNLELNFIREFEMVYQLNTISEADALCDWTVSRFSYELNNILSKNENRISPIKDIKIGVSLGCEFVTIRCEILYSK